MNAFVPGWVFFYLLNYSSAHTCNLIGRYLFMCTRVVKTATAYIEGLR